MENILENNPETPEPVEPGTSDNPADLTEASAAEGEREEIDLNHLFPEEDGDLNALFPETDMRSLLKKIQRAKKDLGRMKSRFEATGEEIEERLEEAAEDPDPQA